MENLPESPFSESILASSSSSQPQKNPNDLGALTPNKLVLLVHDASIREEVMHHLYKVCTEETGESPDPHNFREGNTVAHMLASEG
uniref:Uncharacterized protein n=1 Tax=Solanum tuberosum TaxID=4113 RepID=M0ZKP0_SOLTU